MKPTSDSQPAPGKDPGTTSPTPTVDFWVATLRLLLASRLWGGGRSEAGGVNARA